MTDALNNAELKRRSISGAKWLILTNFFGMPAAYLIALILGHTGPTALGSYALAQILVGVITTFGMYGGSDVLRNYMPKMTGGEERGRFLFAYAVILAVVLGLVLGGFYLFPEWLEFLLRREFAGGDFLGFVTLAIVVVGSECLMGAAAGLMQIKLAAIARLMSRVVMLPLVAALFIFDRTYLSAHTMEVMLAGFMIAYASGALLCAACLFRDPRFRFRVGWCLPPGFGAFTFTTTLATVFSFIYTNFDRMCVLSVTDLQGLGMYQAVVSLMMLIEYIPSMLQTAIVPVFSGLQEPEHRPSLVRAFYYIRRNAVLLISGVSIIMIAFSREILMLFGEGYGDYYYILALYCFVSVVRAPAFPALAILVSMEKNTFRLVQSAVQLSAQMLLTLIFIQGHGVLAIAGSKMLAGGVSTLVATLYVVYGLKMATNLGRAYRAAVPVALLLVVLRIWVVPQGWTGSTLLCLAGLGLFAAGARLSLAELFGMYQLTFHRTINLATDGVKRDL